MWPYWFMFFLAALGVIASLRDLNGELKNSEHRLAWVAVLIIFTLMIGFRHDVGGDWANYARHFNHISYMTFDETLQYTDPGYYLLNWVVARAGGTIYSVNLVCAVLVVWGVGHFCRQQPMPWLSLLVSVPYLLVVVAMGYSRQSVALGMALIALTYLGKHQTLKFVVYVLLGALFHKSAVLLLPIAALSATTSRIYTFIWVCVVAASGAYFLVLDSAEILWENYVEANYRSQGGLIRVLMNAVPSIILIALRKWLFYSDTERKLWVWLAIFSLATVPLVTISSTAVDRIALYFIPLQLFTFSRLPFLANRIEWRQLLTIGVVAYYALVQFVWLNFASHAFAWLPYQSYFNL